MSKNHALKIHVQFHLINSLLLNVFFFPPHLVWNFTLKNGGFVRVGGMIISSSLKREKFKAMKQQGTISIRDK